MRWHLPLGNKVGSLDSNKRLGKSDGVVDGKSEYNKLGVDEKESEGIELGSIDGVKLGKEEGSALGIFLLGTWEGADDSVGVSLCKTTSLSGENAVDGDISIS